MAAVLERAEDDGQVPPGTGVRVLKGVPDVKHAGRLDGAGGLVYLVVLALGVDGGCLVAGGAGAVGRGGRRG